MPPEKIPPLTVQQRLFVDRFWSNGGNMVEAVEFADYRGYPTGSDKAKKARQLLASKPIKAYIAYLRAAAKADERQRAEAKALAEIRARDKAQEETQEGGKASESLGGIPKIRQLSKDVKDRDFHSSNEDGSNGQLDSLHVEGLGTGNGSYPQGYPQAEEGGYSVPTPSHISPDFGIKPEPPNCPPPDPNWSASWPGAPRGSALVGASTLMAGTILPPTAAGQPQHWVSRELTPVEVRELLADIARGNQRGMTDSRVRMRAIELAMRNMGMLVEMSLSATAKVGEEAKAMSPAERDAEMLRLESFIQSIRELGSKGGKPG